MGDGVIVVVGWAQGGEGTVSYAVCEGIGESKVAVTAEAVHGGPDLCGGGGCAISGPVPIHCVPGISTILQCLLIDRNEISVPWQELRNTMY